MTEEKKSAKDKVSDGIKQGIGVLSAFKEALEETPPGFLAERQAVYVSAISGMPRLITRMFAIPSMRDRSYSVWLDRDGDATARLPTERGKATLIFFRDREITRVEHLATPEDVRRVLGQTKSSPDESE